MLGDTHARTRVPKSVYAPPVAVFSFTRSGLDINECSVCVFATTHIRRHEVDAVGSGLPVKHCLSVSGEFSFNFPRVSAQLKRLMGTNVVRLTDRNYMVDLRRRIQEDCAQMQAKRIETREVIASLRVSVRCR